MKKIKTYRAPLSSVFPATHPRAGEETNFKKAIECGVDCIKDSLGNPIVFCFEKIRDKNCNETIKIHTCRANYPLWKKRIDEVIAGNAVLVLYEWTEKPYRSKTHNIFIFHSSKAQYFVDDLQKDEKYRDALFVCDSGIGVQELVFPKKKLEIDFPPIYRYGQCFNDSPVATHKLEELANNDGLSMQDFEAWFKGYDLSEPMAIVHFTKFRY